MGDRIRGLLEFTAAIHQHHRPGIARVEGDRVVLDGTTIEEVERWHLDTLKLCVEEANKAVARFRLEQERRGADAQRMRQEHISPCRLLDTAVMSVAPEAGATTESILQ